MTKAALIGAAVGTAGLVTAAKLSKKPIGCKGSIAHIMSNDKLDGKAKARTFAQIAGQTAKDTVTIAGVTAGAAGAAAVASKSAKFTNFLKNAKSKAGEALSNVSIKGKDLKSTIKETGLYKKISALPKPAKAAVAVGSAVLGALGSIWMLKSAGDAGYIEGQNERPNLVVKY